jgi:zinc transport system substrate-binding protein
MRPFAKSVVLLAGALLAACSDNPSPVAEPELARSADRLQVVAINAPLAYFAERLGGDLFRVDTLAEVGIDPADWQPSVADVMAMQEADLILLNGAGYEPWLERVSLPAPRVLISSEAVTEQLIESETITHQHGPEGAHSHTETAFTLWLDPLLAVEQARAVGSAISVLHPQAANEIEERMDDLEQELLQLHEAWLRVVVQIGSAPLLFSHPVYQYLERRYQLNGRSLHWEPDEDPGESEWSSIVALLETQPATLMIWEAEPLPDIASRLDAMGVSVLVVEPAADVDPDATYLERQRANVARLSTALEDPQ